MKKINLLTVLVMLLVLPVMVGAQDSQKEIKVKMVKVVDGTTTVIDTVFSSKADLKQEMKWMIDEIAEVDSVEHKNIRVEIMGDDEDGDEREYEVFYSGDGSDSHVLYTSPRGKKKVVKWVDADGEDQEFELNLEMENLDGLGEEIERQVFINLGQSKDLERQLERLEHENPVFFERMPPPPPPVPPVHPDYPDREMFWVQKNHRSGGSVSEGELRDAGIKNQPDLLKLCQLDIDNRDGVITLRFLPEEEQGSSKVLVYNYFGEKVFSGKPEMIGDVFQITIDLSSKHPGTYYLQIIQKKASVTERIRL